MKIPPRRPARTNGARASKASSTIKVVELEGEGSYKYTKTSETSVKQSDKEVRTMKFTVRMLDKQKQPKIEAVK
jgi:hypothetical protein